MSRLALFFTMGMSVKKWHDAGLAQRDSLLYERLCAQGWEVFFVTYGGTDDHRYLPVGSQIQVLPKPDGLSDREYGWRIPFIHRDILRTTDVIKSHQISGSKFALWTKIWLRKPYVARCGYIYAFRPEPGQHSLRSRVASRLERSLSILSFRWADAVCVPSQAEIDFICQHHGIDPHKAHANPNWVDTDRFKPDDTVQKNPFRVCFVGRFVAKKQPLLLLEALRGLRDIELLMIGGGDLQGEIEAKVQEYGIKATMVARVPNEALPEYLNSSGVYVLPTLYEGGSPKTLLEAMACGLPVVSTNGFGVNEAFEHGTHGYKCNPHDVQAFRKAILTLVNDHEHSRLLGQQGRQHVMANYSIDRAVTRELEILREVCKTNRT